MLTSAPNGTTSNAPPTARLRRTLIIGLGGMGTRIATELKARLEEGLGAESNYGKAIKFLCFDTATDNEGIPMPNHPKTIVSMEPEREFVRISDISLYELMQQKARYPALSAILPSVLYSTQIDQGAQQIRRLGRVALLYHFNEIVARKLTQTIGEIRSPSVMGRIGNARDGRALTLADHTHLRIYVCASMCGGTGSGMFLDMAYLARHLAGSNSTTEVIGMLALPEAFPDIATTGRTRIRANAYAALLDLEYYMQATGTDATLYHVQPVNGTEISVSGSPFALCYLVSRTNLESLSLGSKNEVAAVVGEAMFHLIASPLGEGIDGTLDNIRSSLTEFYTTESGGGFRAFYSALGIGQIAFPSAWVEQHFTDRLSALLIDLYPLRQGDKHKWETFTTTTYEALSVTIDRALGGGLIEIMENTVLYPLLNARGDAGKQGDARADVQRAFRETQHQFGIRIEAALAERVTVALRDVRMEVVKRLHAIIDSVLDAKNESSQPKGFYSASEWLARLQAKIDAILLENASTLSGRYSADASLERALSLIYEVQATPLVGRQRAMRRARHACDQLIGDFRDQALPAQIDVTRAQIFGELRTVLESLQGQVRAAIAFWSDLKRQERALFPEYSPFTQSFPDRNVLESALEAGVERVLQRSELASQFAALPPLHSTLDIAQQPMMRNAFNTFTLENAHSELPTAVTQWISQEDSIYRGDLFTNLSTRAQPLLEYRRGMLAQLTVPQIKVLGAETNDVAQRILREGVRDTTDAKALATRNPALITYLTTHHGIPAVALSHFGEYRAAYEDLIRGKNAIFHLDEGLEATPYDPDSAYFVHYEDFLMLFARCCAYGWLSKPHLNAPMFIAKVFAEAFISEIEIYNTRLLRDLESNPEGESVSESEVTRALRHERIAQTRATLTHFGNGLRSNNDGYVLAQGMGVMMSVSDALQGLSRRLVQTVFVRTFARCIQETANPDALIHSLDTFLHARYNVTSSAWWSLPDTRERVQEEMLCERLNLFRRGERKLLFSKRGSERFGYMLDDTPSSISTEIS